VREAAVGDGDLEVGAHAEREQRAMARVEAADGTQDLDPMEPHPEQVPEDRHGGWPGGQAAAGLAAVLGVVEQQEGERKEESSEERPGELHLF